METRNWKKNFFDIKTLLSITVVANNYVFVSCSELSKLEIKYFFNIKNLLSITVVAKKC